MPDKNSRDISRRIWNNSWYFKIVVCLFHNSSQTHDNIFWNYGWKALQQKLKQLSLFYVEQLERASGRD
jgi:hypothetical protein